MEFSNYDVHARRMAGHLASALFESWTSDQQDVSDYRYALPVLLGTAFQEALVVTYKLTVPQARLVRDLLAEYGLDDQLDGTHAMGLEGLVEFVVTNPNYPQGY